MARNRTDNVFGTLTDDPLTDSATTMNSGGLANLAVISGSEAIIILDPNRVSGAPEYVKVTAHSGSATSATISRGEFGSTAREHAAGTAWVHGPITSNATSYATGADDQGDFVPMNAWEVWTPAWTQSATVSHTVGRAKYVRIGRTIHLLASLTASSAGTSGNAIVVSNFPVAAAATSAIMGSYRYFDSGNTIYTGAAYGASTTSVNFQVSGNGNPMGVNPTFAVASGDVIWFQVTYEAAS